MILPVLFLLGSFAAPAQTVTTDLEGYVEGWASGDRCYQHRLSADANVGARWGRMSASAYMQFVWWGACDAKIKGSLFNAESGRVLQRGHGIRVLVWPIQSQKVRVGVGAVVRRDAAHHLWRSAPDWRHNQFPHDNSWRGAKGRCKAPESAEKVKPHAEGVCPGIGYEDGTGPALAVRTPWFHVRATAPFIHWKPLTLPSPILEWSGEALKTRALYVRTSGEVTEEGAALVDVEAGYALSETVAIGVAGGVLGVPGWRSDLRRIALVLRAD